MTKTIEEGGLPPAIASPWSWRPKRRTVPRPNCATHPAGLIRPPTSAFDRRPLRLDHGDASAGPRATAGRADIGVRRLGVGVVGTGKYGTELTQRYVGPVWSAPDASLSPTKISRLRTIKSCSAHSWAVSSRKIRDPLW